MYIPPAIMMSTSLISSGSVLFGIFVTLNDILINKATKKTERNISMLR
jgi:hypothetical protein